MKLFLSPTIHKIRSFLLPTLPFSRHKATKKAPRVISVPLMSGVLRYSNVAFSALLRITLQPFALHSKESSVTFQREQWCISLPLMQRQPFR